MLSINRFQRQPNGIDEVIDFFEFFFLNIYFEIKFQICLDLKCFLFWVTQDDRRW